MKKILILLAFAIIGSSRVLANNTVTIINKTNLNVDIATHYIFSLKKKNERGKKLISIKPKSKFVMNVSDDQCDEYYEANTKEKTYFGGFEQSVVSDEFKLPCGDSTVTISKITKEMSWYIGKNPRPALKVTVQQK